MRIAGSWHKCDDGVIRPVLLVGVGGPAATTVAEGRRLTLEILQDVFGKKGDSVRSIIGRCSNMDEKQIEKLRRLLEAVKRI